MNWAEWLLGEKPRLKHRGHLAGTGEYATHLSPSPADAFDEAVEQIIGERTSHSQHLECTAFLVPESDQLDAEAVAVIVSGCTVGYLGTEHAALYRDFLSNHDLGSAASCDALIQGGWKRGDARGAFSVRLDLEWPLRLEE